MRYVLDLIFDLYLSTYSIPDVEVPQVSSIFWLYLSINHFLFYFYTYQTMTRISSLLQDPITLTPFEGFSSSTDSPFNLSYSSLIGHRSSIRTPYHTYLLYRVSLSSSLLHCLVRFRILRVLTLLLSTSLFYLSICPRSGVS